MAAPAPALARPRLALPRGTWGAGFVSAYLSLIVLIPLAAVAAKVIDAGSAAFWTAISARQSVGALELTLGASLAVTAITAVAGTLVAWVLVRDEFPGHGLLNSIIDLPLALPTIVGGLTLLALYGPGGPLGIDLAFTRAGIVMALLFVTLPFVVRAVQPVLAELEREQEEAAVSLGAGNWVTFRRIVLPAVRPAIAAGSALAFARAVGEFGAVVLISGNIPLKTQMASVLVFNQVESDAPAAAASVSLVLLAVSAIVLLIVRGLRGTGSPA